MEPEMGWRDFTGDLEFDGAGYTLASVREPWCATLLRQLQEHADQPGSLTLTPVSGGGTATAAATTAAAAAGPTMTLSYPLRPQSYEAMSAPSLSSHQHASLPQPPRAAAFRLARAGTRFALPSRAPVHSLGLSPDGRVLSARDAAGRAHLLLRTAGGPLARVEVPAWDADGPAVSRSVDSMPDRDPALSDTRVGLPVRLERLPGGSRTAGAGADGSSWGRVLVQFARVGFEDQDTSRQDGQLLGRFWRRSPKLVTSWTRRIVSDELGPAGTDVVNPHVDPLAGIAAWSVAEPAHVTIVDLGSDSVTRLGGVVADAVRVGPGPDGDHVVVVHDSGRVTIHPRHGMMGSGQEPSEKKRDTHLTLDGFRGDRVAAPAGAAPAKGSSWFCGSPAPPVLYTVPAIPASAAASGSILRGPAVDVCVAGEVIAVAWPAYNPTTLRPQGHLVGVLDAMSGRPVCARLVPAAGGVPYVGSCAFSPDGRYFASVDAGRAYLTDLRAGGGQDAMPQPLDLGRCRPRDVRPVFMPDCRGLFILGADVEEDRAGAGDVLLFFRESGVEEAAAVAGRWDQIAWVGDSATAAALAGRVGNGEDAGSRDDYDDDEPAMQCGIELCGRTLSFGLWK